VREIARRHGGVGTVGSVTTEPGIPTAVPGLCEITLDQRHPDSDGLGVMLGDARQAAGWIGREEHVDVEWERTYGIDPVPFHPEMVELADAAVRETTGRCHRLTSGPLHDATEMARAGIPAAMLFVQSLRGLSHAKEEDTRADHLELSVEALDRLASKAMTRVAGGA
jgi:N-carbamoyl-L-amino-acid hydrolase